MGKVITRQERSKTMPNEKKQKVNDEDIITELNNFIVQQAYNLVKEVIIPFLKYLHIDFVLDTTKKQEVKSTLEITGISLVIEGKPVVIPIEALDREYGKKELLEPFLNMISFIRHERELQGENHGN
jgi:hypothetical protein